jgi:hypothetical protein
MSVRIAGTGILLAQERNGVLQPAAVVRQFVRGQGVEGVFRLIHGGGLRGGCGGWHRLAVLVRGAGVFSLPNVPAREHN